MGGFSAAGELQQMREIVAQCTAQALIARQQSGRYAPYYRAQAEHFRLLAASTRFANLQATRLRIATTYERLAERAESMAGIAKLGGKITYQRQRPTDNERSVRAAPEEPSRASLGEPPAGAHFSNAKTQSMSYEAQAAEVPNDDRQIASAALVKSAFNGKTGGPPPWTAEASKA